MSVAEKEDAQTWLKRLNDFDQTASERLEFLVGAVLEENGRQNLIARSTLDTIWRRHVVDSAQLLHHATDVNGLWLDLGSGAGFPGLVVAALQPHRTVHLVECRRLRSEWLQATIKRMGLTNVLVTPTRVEQLQTTAASVISARAFAPLPRLVALAARFSTPLTQWLLPKGRTARQELLSLTGWAHTFHVEPSITDDAGGIIIGRLLGSSRELQKARR